MPRAFRRILACLSFAALGYVLVTQSSSLDWRAVRTHGLDAWAALVCFVASVALGYFSWEVLLRRDRQLLSRRESYSLFAMSWLSRYLPGGTVWQYVVLGQSAPSEVRTEALSAYFFSTVLGLIAGATWAAVFLPLVWAGVGVPPTQAFAGAGLALALAALCSRSVNALLSGTVTRFFPKVPPFSPLRVRTALSAYVINLGAWVFSVLGSIFLYRMLGKPVGWEEVSFFLAAYALATTGAYFTFLTPSGIGIREGAFALLLTQRLSAGEAGFVATATAVGLIVAEGVFLLPMAANSLKSSRGLFRYGRSEPLESGLDRLST